MPFFVLSYGEECIFVYLYKFAIVYFPGRVLWRSADLWSTPHILTSLPERETDPVRI